MNANSPGAAWQIKPAEISGCAPFLLTYGSVLALSVLDYAYGPGRKSGREGQPQFFGSSRAEDG